MFSSNSLIAIIFFSGVWAEWFECPKTGNFSSDTSSPSGKPGVQRATLLLAARVIVMMI